MRTVRSGRVWVAATLIIIGFVGLVGVVGPWWIRREVTAVLAARSGVAASLRDVDVFHDGFALKGATFYGRSQGVRATVSSARVRCAAWLWLWEGASSCGAVRVDGLSLELDFGAREFASWSESRLSRARSAVGPASGVGPPPQDPARSVRAEQVNIRVHDPHGPLISLERGRVELTGGRAGFSAELVVLGAGDRERWSFERVDAAAVREEGSWKLAGLSLRDGRVVSGTQGAAPTLRERLEAGFALVRPRMPATGNGADTTGASRSGHWSTGWARLASRANIWMSGVDVAVRGPNGEQDLVHELGGAMVRNPSDVLRTWGTANGLPDGALRWAIELRPADLRGEGTLRMDNFPVGILGPLLPGFALQSARDARLDGDLALRGDGLDNLGLAGNLRVRGLVFDSPRIAPTPVRGVTLEVSGRGAWIPARGRIQFEGARIALGEDAGARGAAVGVIAAGGLEWTPDRYLVDVLTTLPPTPCGAAVAAIPRDLLAEVAGFRMGGTLAGRLRVFIDSLDLAATQVDLEVNDACVFEEVPAFADMRRFGEPFVQRVQEPDGREFAFETGLGSEAWTPIADMSPFLLHAVMAHEDAGFLAHHGFAASEIQVALVRNLSAGRYVQGASTITMQLVKNIFLHREKTLARKVQEVLLTWWTESVFTKERILELYLNVIEYGPSIYGIRSAAMHYFGREPRDLSVAESAFLATILPSPKLFHSAYVDGRPSLRLRERLRGFLRRLAARGRIDETALQGGLAEVDQMAFYREGGELPPARALVGAARPLPFGTSADVAAEWSDAGGDGADEGDAVSPSGADGSDVGWSSDGE